MASTTIRHQCTSGQRFGRLTLAEKIPGSRKVKAAWLCRCDCGNTTTLPTNALTSGNTRSCGCLLREVRRTKPITHGLRKSPEFTAWVNLRGRCLNASRKCYSDYGGRGITVCDRWIQSFENFYADMGQRPSPKHSIDRIDNDGPYSPDNCRWTTRDVQNTNQRKKTHCKHGHEFNLENTILYSAPTGTSWRRCRQCLRAADAAYRSRLASKSRDQ